MKRHINFNSLLNGIILAVASFGVVKIDHAYTALIQVEATQKIMFDRLALIENMEKGQLVKEREQDDQIVFIKSDITDIRQVLTNHNRRISSLENKVH